MSRKKRRSAKNHADRHSSKFTLYSGLYLYFPPLNKEQESEKQRQVVEGRRKNKENWHPNNEKVSVETFRRIAKERWATNKKFREKVLEWVHSEECRRAILKAGVISVEVRRVKGFNPENFGDRNKQLKEIRKIADKYGISLKRTSSLSNKELEALYYKMKQW